MKKYFSLVLWLFTLPMWADNFGSIDAARNLGPDRLYFGALVGAAYIDQVGPFPSLQNEGVYSGFIGLDHPLDSHWGAGGELSLDATNSNVNVNTLDIFNFSQQVRSNDVGLYARVRYELPRGDLFAKAGVAYVWQTSLLGTSSDEVPAFGLGWNYRFHLSEERSLDILFQWTHLQSGVQVGAVDMAQIGLAYGLPL